MRKRMKLLLASSTTVAGLVAGVIPASAAIKPAEDIGFAFQELDFGGFGRRLSSGVECDPIAPGAELTRSAYNSSSSSTITLYRALAFENGEFRCADRVTTLGPGQNDSGRLLGPGTLSNLGRNGASFYSST